MTSTIESVPFAGAADPTAFANPANLSSARSGMSFADICAGQLSQSPEIQAAAPAAELPSNSSAQSGNTTPNTPAARNSAKNMPTTGSSPVLPVLALLVPAPPVPLPGPVNTLTTSQAQPIEGLPSVDSTKQIGGGFDGRVQSTSFAPAAGSATPPALTSEDMSESSTATAVPSFASTVSPSPQAPGSASVPAPDPWPLSPPSASNSAPANSSSRSSSAGSPSSLPNGIGAQGPTFENTPADAPDDVSPEIISAARTTFELDTQTPSAVAPTTSEVPSLTPDTLSPLTREDAEQASPSQAPQVSFAAAQTSAPPEEASANVIQVAETSSSQPEQPAPADPESPPRSVMQPQSPLDQQASRSSSAPGPGASAPGASPVHFAGTATNPASHAAVPGRTQPVPSAATSSAAAHGITSITPAIPPAANPPTRSTSQDDFNNAPQPGNPSASASGAQAPAASTASASPASAGPASASPASSSRKDSGGQSDSDQHKDSPNAVVASADASPTVPIGITVATPSAQGNVPQPRSAADAGPKANPQTSTGSSANAPRSSLPSTTDALPVAGASPLQWAQMANKAGQSEMRIGLNTTEFGSVEVRTTVHASDVGVLIGSEKGDLRSLLTPELPGIASTLQQQDLRLGQVHFHQQGFAFAGDSSSEGHSQPRSYSSRPQPAADISEESTAAEPVRTSDALSGHGAGLSILA